MKTRALSSIRRENLRKVLDLLIGEKTMTRTELAEAAGLSQMTVTNLVDLLKEQEVLQLQPIQRAEKRPAQGRKAEAISLYGGRKAWLLVDISNSLFTLTLLGFDLSLLLQLRDEGQGGYLPRLEAFLRQAGEQLLPALAGRELLGVAIVTPGPYDIANDTVYNQRIPQLNGVKIKALFHRCLGAYEYYVDEDVKFAVRAFTDLSGSGQSEVLYYLYIGEGVGGAVVHSGDMLRGLNAVAGDAGHLLDGRGDTYESRLSIGAFLRVLGVNEALSPEEMACEVERVAREAPQRYFSALDVMARAASEMLHGVLWLLDPTCIIVDCVYAQHDRDAFVQLMEKHLQCRFEAEKRMLPRIVPSAAGVSSVQRGAISVLQREWLERILM